MDAAKHKHQRVVQKNRDLVDHKTPNNRLGPRSQLEPRNKPDLPVTCHNTTKPVIPNTREPAPVNTTTTAVISKKHQKHHRASQNNKPEPRWTTPLPPPPRPHTNTTCGNYTPLGQTSTPDTGLKLNKEETGESTLPSGPRSHHVKTKHAASGAHARGAMTALQPC